MGTRTTMHNQTHAKYQAQARRTGGRVDMAEQQVTACLNNAAAQQQPLQTCRQ